MAGRKWTSQPAAGSAGGRPRARKNTQKRSLNAFSIASQQNPERLKVRQHRLGDLDEDNGRRKRQKLDGGDRRPSDDEDMDAEDGSDSEGNEWRLGQVDSDDDSDLDSEEAFGESDDDRFEGFTFRGSSSNKPAKRNKTRAADIDLNEDEEAEDQGSDEDDESLGEDAVDLATMLDNYEEEASGDEQASKGKSTHKATDASDEESESNDEDTGNSEEESDNEGSAFSISDDEGQGEDPARLSALQSLVSNLSGSIDKSTKRQQGTDVHESTTPSDYALNTSQKLSIADLLPSVTDPGLKKSLKLLSSEQSAPSKRSGIPSKLDAPLPKRQQDRLDREAAYEKSKETLDRWIDTVKHNRRAEHLSFPLANPSTEAAQGRGRSLATTSTQPLTELEGAIFEIMQQSGLAEKSGKSEEDQIREFEELKTNKLPLEEVQARRAELRKARELLFREEARAKRIKKIKSKSYRRVHRKQREKEEQAEREALAAAGVGMSEDEAERVHRKRAEERMGGRHKSSRWAKGVKESGRAAWDEDARSGVMEMARRDDELRRRIEGKTIRNESESESNMSDEDNEESEEDGDSDEASARRLRRQLDRANGDSTSDGNGRSIGSKLANMKFMQRAEAAQKMQNDAEAAQLRKDLAGGDSSSGEEEDEPANVGRRKFGPAPTVRTPLQKDTPRNEFEERIDSDDEAEEAARQADDDIDIILDKEPTHKTPATTGGKPSTDKRLSRQPKGSTQIDNDADNQQNPWLVAPAKKSPVDPASAVLNLDGGASLVAKSATKNGQRKVSVEKAGKSSTNPGASAKQQTAVIIGPEDETSDSEDSEAGNPHLPFVLRNQDLVKKAFAGDEVVEDFEEEKKHTGEDEDEKVVDNTLPGWGSWTGTGVSKKQEKRNKGRFLSKEEGIKKDQRKDAKLDRVIINEKRVKKNAKYLASNLPHPFETRQQYERSLRLPVGPEWTTKETFQSATKPKVMVKRGVITPMDRPMV